MRAPREPGVITSGPPRAVADACPAFIGAVTVITKTRPAALASDG